MLSNYLKIAFRTLSKYKLNSFIHILGLSLGITCCALIYMFVRHEKSFDGFHDNADRIYRVIMDVERESGLEHEGNTPYPLAPALRVDLADEITAGRIHVAQGSMIELENKDRYITDFIFAEPEMTEILSFNEIAGDLEKTLSEPNQIALTKSYSERLFGSKNPIGQVVRIDNILEMEVTSIIEDLPSNGHLRGTMIASFESFDRDFLGFNPESWGVNIGGITYLKIPKKISINQVEDQLVAFAEKTFKNRNEGQKTFKLQPLRKIHFDLEYGAAGIAPSLNKKYLLFFSAIGLLILIMASINFINLSTAQSQKRAREIGIRKIVGARRAQLILQFLGETFLISFTAMLVAFVLINFSLPRINSLLQMDITLFWEGDYQAVIFIFCITIAIALFSGLYPAFVISNFQPLKSLHTRKSSGSPGRGLMFRKTLVTTQFVISMLLVIGTIAISRQLKFFRSQDLGFNKEYVIELNMPDRDHFDRLRTEWQSHPGIIGTSFALGAPTSANSIHTSIYPDPQNPDKPFSIAFKAVDRYYQKVFDLDLIAGRWFSRSEENQTSVDLPPEERKYTMLVNERLTRDLGYADPSGILGKNIKVGVYNIDAEVIGVTKDFHMTSLHDPITPMIMLNFPQWYYTANIRLNPNQVQTGLTHIEKVWGNVFPDYLFDYGFVDESLAALYENEEKLFQLFEIFAGIALLIACLGLWGLVTFITESKSREFGIRKALGASGVQIASLISFQFLKLLGIAFVISSPIAWAGINSWLQNFSYRIDIGLPTFILGGCLVLFMTWLTLTYHSLKAAFINPVDSIRNE